MRIAILSNEYPPNVYGGAGVHVEYLTQNLALLDNHAHQIDVYCFGHQQEKTGNIHVSGIDPKISPPFQHKKHKRFMETILKDIFMIGAVPEADVLHCHTWYSHLAGLILKQLTGAPLVLSTHSLEPHRPWKAEQLGTGYNGSSWIEKTAYQNADGVIAVSEAMKEDVIELYQVSPEKTQVIHNGIDLNQYKKVDNPQLVSSYGIDPNKPFVLFVGRITRQKGIIHLVNAIKYIEPKVQIVLCAGAPDTEEIGEEMKERVEKAREDSEHKIIWIPKMLSKEDVITLYSHASIFVCPSVYEPFGIINLEAMACHTPVVASHVGGIPEIINQNETGLLVPLDHISDNNFEPKDPDRFSQDLAAAVSQLLSDSEKVKVMGEKSRKRVETHFSWTRIAEGTLAYYQQLIG